jgi:hypothetical protein
MCPFHHFVSSPGCRYCCAFAGGFVGGFVYAPSKWRRGVQRIQSQGGVILSEPGKPEEDENRLIGSEIRAVQGMNNGRNREQAREAWNRLPQGARNRLTESGFGAVGQFFGGIAAAQVLVFTVGYLGARLTMLHPRMRPLAALARPVNITVSTILATLSLQGSFADLMDAQRQIFRQCPGSEEVLRDTLEKINNNEKS